MWVKLKINYNSNEGTFQQVQQCGSFLCFYNIFLGNDGALCTEYMTPHRKHMLVKPFDQFIVGFGLFIRFVDNKKTGVKQL